MVLIEPNKTGAVWTRAMFRYFCRKHNCTVIKVNEREFAAEGDAESRRAANFDYERELGKLLIRVVNARAKEPHRDAKRVTLETIRAHVKELYSVQGS